MKELFDTNERSRITQAIEEMKAEAGDSFCLEKLNLAELERRTGVTRSRLRRLKDSGFEFRPHGNTGKESPRNGLVGYTDTLDKLLKSGVTNSAVCLERLQAVGFTGGSTAVKMYSFFLTEHFAISQGRPAIHFSSPLCYAYTIKGTQP